MKIRIIEKGEENKLGELVLKALPRNGDYVEYNQKLYSIFRIIHTENEIKLIVISVN